MSYISLPFYLLSSAMLRPVLNLYEHPDYCVPEHLICYQRSFITRPILTEDIFHWTPNTGLHLVVDASGSLRLHLVN